MCAVLEVGGCWGDGGDGEGGDEEAGEDGRGGRGGMRCIVGFFWGGGKRMGGLVCVCVCVCVLWWNEEMVSVSL